jgi:hypothetical protein
VQAAQADAQMLVLDLSQAVMSAQQHATEQLSSVGAETEGLSRAHGAAMQEFRQLAMHLQEVRRRQHLEVAWDVHMLTNHEFALCCWQHAHPQALQLSE